MAGVDLATAKEIPRHKNISMTLRYAHLSPDHKKSAVEVLSKALSAEAENRRNGLNTPAVPPSTDLQRK